MAVSERVALGLQRLDDGSALDDIEKVYRNLIDPPYERRRTAQGTRTYFVECIRECAEQMLTADDLLLVVRGS
jgi:hypothetical protein